MTHGPILGVLERLEKGRRKKSRNESRTYSHPIYTQTFTEVQDVFSCIYNHRNFRVTHYLQVSQDVFY